MKNVKLMLVFTAMLIFGMGNVNAQDNVSKTVIIRVTESLFRGKPSIITIDSEGKTSIVDLNGGLDETGANTIRIHQEINKWKKEGYEIDGISNSAIGETTMITLVILSKEN